MSRALFISDLHIRSHKDPKCELFARFLERCARLRPEHLFLVGDIFDLWVADRDYFVSAYDEIISRIRALIDSGVDIYYFEGNHDLDLRPFWQERLRLKVFEGPAYFDLLGRTVRVEHGDQMDPDDKGYLFLRWLLRTPALRGLGRNLPNAAVRWIGERASRLSRDYTSQVKVISESEVRAKFLRHIDSAFAEKSFDVLVCGHVHVADDLTLDREGRTVRAFNLGTWLKEPLVLDLTPTSEALVPVAQFLTD